MMRIGFLTTLGVNVGDEFIREGIRAILDCTGIRYYPFYVNKHDVRSLTLPQDDEMFVLADKYWDADIFIQAGAPVYWHLFNGTSTSLTSAWHEWMWHERILNDTRSGPVFLNLGAGSCQPWDDNGDAFLGDPGCVDFARKAAERAAETTVRDPLASRILSALSLSHHSMPCPAFLAACRNTVSVPGHGVVGVNLMPLGGHYEIDVEFNGDLWQSSCTRLVDDLRKCGQLLFIAHNSSEAAFMSRFACPDERTFHAYGWRDYLDVYSSCRAVVSNRVHGAVCAAGFGVPAVIVGNDSRASIGDFIGLPRFRSGSDVEPIVVAVQSLIRTRNHEADRLMALRESTLAAYTDLLSPILQNVQTASQSSRRRNLRRPSYIALTSPRDVKAPQQDRRVLVVHTGGLGDLVLLSELFASLKGSNPSWHISLMCRPEMASVTSLYSVPPDEIVPLRFNPYASTVPSGDLCATLQPIVDELKCRNADILVSGELRPTWFSWLA